MQKSEGLVWQHVSRLLYVIPGAFKIELRICSTLQKVSHFELA